MTAEDKMGKFTFSEFSRPFGNNIIDTHGKSFELVPQVNCVLSGTS